GLDRYEARKQIVAELEQEGLLVRIEDYSHNVGTHDRCGTTIEPMIKQQWFVKMDELIKPAVEAVKNGEIKLVPERMEKIYYNWTDNIRDWCISRQLWWGHRIPAYYCDKCGEIVVAKEEPHVCPKCGETHFTQDPDTLDTWFSSALWPFSTLGWPERTEDLDYFYPTDVLVTGYDIIFFWVIRMVFSGYEQMGEKPFKTVLFHGLVRDSQGRKMSKSLGNGIDPLEIIDKYGADALRLTLITGNAPGNDMRFYYERVEASRNFANKIWNASRFIMMNMEQEEERTGKRGWEIPYEEIKDSLRPGDKWILSRFNTLVQDMTVNMDNFELGIAVQKVYDFIWDEFCDWYIEMVKPRLYSTEAGEEEAKRAALWTLQNVLTGSMKLLHPYMPFITEEIFCTLQNKEESIMISNWPTFGTNKRYIREENAIELLKAAVRGIRNVRTEMNVAPGKKAAIYVVSEDEEVRQTFEKGRQFLTVLGSASSMTVQADRSGIDDSAVSVVVPNATVYIPFEELVDIAQEIERLKKEQKRLEGELARVQGMLGNERFMAKAPETKIAEEREKLAKYTQMKEQVEERLAQLG
ncbi:MAG: valine--tRNA ligase, partial [Lachnospiraceae bacterium]|nr:valine--tRNA ligase [Lachnospiraceae bacterium]